MSPPPTIQDPDALNNLGVRLTDSRCPGDAARGIALLKRAYRLGSIVAAANLALAYSEQGNRRRCIHWLRKACLRPESADWYHLAIAHAAGYGVRRDPALAARLFRQVAGDPSAFPIERERSRAFLALLSRRIPIRVTTSLGRTHPESQSSQYRPSTDSTLPAASNTTSRRQ